MKKLYLTQIGRQLFAIDRKCVIGVGICSSTSFKTIREGNQLYLPLPNGTRALICDVQALMAGPDEGIPARPHYLIVNHNNLIMGLAMNDKGTTIMADIALAQPLPPAFTGQSRKLVPGLLTVDSDLVLLLDLQALLEATTECAPSAETEA